MFSFNSNSRRGVNLLSAGAAALLLTGLGVSNANTVALNWNPGGTVPPTTASEVGSATWDNGVTSDWYDTTSSAQSTWAAGDGAYFLSTSSTDVETVTLAASVSASTFVEISTHNTFAGNITFVGNGTTSGSDTLTVTGVAHLGGSATSGGYSTAPVYTNPDTFNLANIIFDSTGTADGDIAVWGSTLNIGTGAGGAIVNASGYFVDGGGNTSTVNVNANSTLSVANQIRIGGQAGAGNTHGSTLNVNGGAVTVGGGGILLSNGTTTGATGTLNMNSGTLNAGINIINTTFPSSHANTGTLNLNGGVLSTGHITETTGSTTIVNFNGGTLRAMVTTGLIGNPGTGTTVPTNLNVLAGGAIIDSNNFNPVIYEPLLHGGSGIDGGLTIENSAYTSGFPSSAVSINGTQTYTGPTTVDTGGNLTLEAGRFTLTPTPASIADSSGLTVNADGVFDISAFTANGGVSTYSTATASVQALTLSGNSILRVSTDNSGHTSEIVVGSTASVTGTNYIDVALVTASTPTAPPYPPGGPGSVPTADTSLTPGTYTLISDAAGGLLGTFNFISDSNVIGGSTETVAVGSDNYQLTLLDSATALQLQIGPGTAIPEPTAVALLAVGALGGLLLIRRRKPAA